MSSRKPKNTNNHKTKPHKKREKPVFASGTSKENRFWQQKRNERYNQRMWPGWRETDDTPAPVTTYNIKDLQA